MKKKFNYFYGNQAQLFAFYRTPKAFFQDEWYKDLSAEAKILYGILLDRVSLSAMNEWKYYFCKKLTWHQKQYLHAFR